MTITPIALFTYNRAEHTARVLDSLSNCSRLAECRLHIYCDGARKREHAKSVEASRQVVRSRAEGLSAIVIERDTNFGLARSIVRGVTDLCNQFGRVIVVEDDLVLSPSFLDYMLEALDRYANETSVYQVSGYMFPVEHPPSPDAFFLPLTTTWGWATWSRAWKILDWDATDAYASLRDPELRRSFDLNNSYPYARMLESRLKGENDSWGILFWWSVFKVGGLVLHPRKSLVWNGGFDNTGTHCGNSSWSNQPGMGMIADDVVPPFRLPDQVATDEAAFGRVARFLRAERSTGNLLGRIRRRIRQRRELQHP